MLIHQHSCLVSLHTFDTEHQTILIKHTQYYRIVQFFDGYDDKLAIKIFSFNSKGGLIIRCCPSIFPHQTIALYNTLKLVPFLFHKVSCNCCVYISPSSPKNKVKLKDFVVSYQSYDGQDALFSFILSDLESLMQLHGLSQHK